VPRVYVDRPLEPGIALELPEAAARHLFQVLRLGGGAQLRVFNGDGRDYTARIDRATRQGARIDVLTAGDEEPPPPLAIHLALGVSRGERMDFAIQKAVELGVAGITPLFTERSMVQLQGERLARRVEHWRGVMIGACEQSGRRRLPRLLEPSRLSDWLAQPHPHTLLLDPGGELPLPALPTPAVRLSLLVGPEGGLAPRERSAARASGVRGVRLGPRILRTETAPLAAIAIIQALWGDLSS
jgi:16S rRNA (uracil1498-N3)-methyltransferase